MCPEECIIGLADTNEGINSSVYLEMKVKSSLVTHIIELSE